MSTPVTAENSRNAKLDITVLQSQLSVKQKHMITEDTVEELTKLSKDPDYGEEFLDMYRDHLNVLGNNPKYTSRGYMSAVKFFALTEAGNNLTDSYVIVFPERLKARTDRGQDKTSITGEASRFNGTALVNEIRKVASIPVQLIHRHLLHEAIISQANLMRTAKSDVVRQKAGEVLIRELKPTEENVLSIKVEDGTKSAIASLQEATEKLIIREQQSIIAGVPIKSIIEAKIIHKEEDLDETAYDTEFEDVVPEIVEEPVVEVTKEIPKKEKVITKWEF